MTTSIAPEVNLGALPALPRAGAEPVFKAPWEAQAFAMTLSLHARGVFTWSEWAGALARELAAAAARGAPDDGSQDRKSTRLNSSHTVISYAVFCLKKKKKTIEQTRRSHAECMATRSA